MYIKSILNDTCAWTPNKIYPGLLVPKLRYPGDEESWITKLRLTMGNPDRQATGSWARQSRYLSLGTWA